MRPAWEMSAFNEVLRDCSLDEIPVTRPSLYEMHIAKNSSNYLPILLKFHGSGDNSKSRSKFFRFENLWLTHKSCEDVVKSGWDVSVSFDMEGVATRIVSCG